MYDDIRFPTDGSEPAESVLEYALQIAAEHGDTVHVLNVADTGRDSVTNIRGEVVDALEEAGQLIGLADNPALEPISKDVEKRFERVLDSL